MISSLKTRLLLAVGLLATGSVVAVGLLARQSARTEFEQFQTVERVRERDEAIGTLDRIAAALDGRCCAGGEISAAAIGVASGRAVFVFDDAGALLEAAGPEVPTTGVRATYKTGEISIETRSTEPGTQGGMSLILKGAPMKSIKRTDGSEATVHLLPWQTGGRGRESPATRFLGSVDRRLLIATVFGAVLALLLTWFAARQILGPIAELRDATADLADGQLHRRVRVVGTDEVAALSRSFNAMAEGLERQVSLRRDLLRDVAHELRTPLTALRCRVETVLDGLGGDPKTALRQVNEEVTHLERLVSDLEQLARAEGRDLAFSMSQTNLAEVCRSAVRAAALEGDSRLRLELGDHVMVEVDPTRLRQVVVNLLTNAGRHTPASGVISLEVARRDKRAVIRVHNSGSTLSPEQLERVFDRFYRADPSRQRSTGGSGLGLAIVKHLVEAQSGTVTAASDDNGVTFEVAFPW